MDVDQILVQLRRERQFLEEAILLLERQKPEFIPLPTDRSESSRRVCGRRQKPGRITRRHRRTGRIMA
jgi:hypothetical protein